MSDRMTARAPEPRVRRAPRAHGAIPAFDVRLRRELSHRRLAISLARRAMRVLSLHVADGLVVYGSVLLVAALWTPFSAAAPFSAAIVAIYLLSLNALSAYRPGDARRDAGRLLSGTLVAGLILTCLTIFPPNLPIEPLFVAALSVVAVIGLIAERKTIDALVRQVYKHGYGLRNAVVIGDLDEVSWSLEQMRDERNIDQYVVGHLSADDQAVDPTALGGPGELPSVLDDQEIEEVIVAAPLSGRRLDRIAEVCFQRGVSLYAYSVATDSTFCRTEVVRLGGCTLMQLHPGRLEFPAMLLKRGVDVVGATVMLLVLAPLFLVLAAAIRLDTPGPVFFRQRRMGVGGRPFTILKFRSMIEGSEVRGTGLDRYNTYPDGRLFKVPDDPRITRVGRFLRRTSFDELPQLINVLKGDMSLVGPRPPLPGEVARYEPHHYERLRVVPGITGPWQVGGRNLITDFEDVVRLERDYIRSWSLFLDLKILLRTVKVVVQRTGAY